MLHAIYKIFGLQYFFLTCFENEEEGERIVF